MIKNNNELRVENGVIYMSLNLICDRCFVKIDKCDINKMIAVLNEMDLVRLTIKDEKIEGFKPTDKLNEILKGHYLAEGHYLDKHFFDVYAAKILVEVYRRYMNEPQLDEDYDILLDDVASFVNKVIKQQHKNEMESRRRGEALDRLIKIEDVTDKYIKNMEEKNMKRNEEAIVINGKIYMSLEYVCKNYFNNPKECQAGDIITLLHDNELLKEYNVDGYILGYKTTDKLSNILEGHFIPTDNMINPIYLDDYAARLIVEIYRRYTVITSTYDLDDIIKESISYIEGLLQLHGELNQKAREREIIKDDEEDEDIDEEYDEGDEEYSEEAELDEDDEDIDEEYDEEYEEYSEEDEVDEDDENDDEDIDEEYDEDDNELTREEELIRLIMNFTKDAMLILNRK